MLCENLNFDEFSRGFANFRCVNFFLRQALKCFLNMLKGLEYV